MMNRALYFLTATVVTMIASCSQPEKKEFTGAEHEVKLITLNPGHFHAALVQKEMYPQVNPTVHIYAPEGPDLNMHLQRIGRFNERQENPTSWISEVYMGDDYLKKLIAGKKGNVVVIAGNNRLKTSYIMESVKAGLNVLSDKPMAINTESFRLLQEAFKTAEQNKVLLYDIMTERYDITSRLQREIALLPGLFGTLEKGTAENPAVVKESVHHFFKYVSGSVLRRPPWYFDILQQGEGIVDVTTHLVDLVQWVCFPDRIINYQTDIDVYDATRRATAITVKQFLDVTGLDTVPEFLGQPDNGVFNVFANGEMHYAINGVHVKVSVIWDYQAPEGGGDTHYSLMKGTKSNLVIRQCKEQNFLPMLYIVPSNGEVTQSWKDEITAEFAAITQIFPGIALQPADEGFVTYIPLSYRIGHEAHFAEVTRKYLQFLVDGKLPEWEEPNMIAKYYTTTRAWELANKKSNQ